MWAGVTSGGLTMMLLMMMVMSPDTPMLVLTLVSLLMVVHIVWLTGVAVLFF
jgi:hypothetical protein